MLALSVHTDISETAKILKEEYGIEAALLDSQNIAASSEQRESLSSSKARFNRKRPAWNQQHNDRTSAPRVIGKPHGFPPHMRRK